jgi:hypothetical protein
MTRAANCADTATNAAQGAIFYMVTPDTGTTKVLKWDWTGTGTSANNYMDFSVTFWKGIDTATPVRDSDKVQVAGAPPYTLPSLTAQTGDLILACANLYVTSGGEASINTWSNLTLLTQGNHIGDADYALATHSPTGNVVCAASTGSTIDDGGLGAIVIQPTAGAATTSFPPFPMSFQYMLIR